MSRPSGAIVEASGAGCQAAYNTGVKLFLKSLGLGLLGASLFFAFFSMLAIPGLAAWSRLHNSNTPLQSGNVVIQPIGFLRTVGLPLAGGVFVTCFVVGWRKFSRTEQRDSRV